MYDVIAYILFSIIIVFQAVVIFFFRNKWKKAIMHVAQLFLDNDALSKKLDMANLENSKEANEGFIKFLSDSREAAFEYIENVQQSVQNYLVAVESGDNDAIITARMELFSYLPEETENEDKNQG